MGTNGRRSSIAGVLLAIAALLLATTAWAEEYAPSDGWVQGAVRSEDIPLDGWVGSPEEASGVEVALDAWATAHLSNTIEVSAPLDGWASAALAETAGTRIAADAAPSTTTVEGSDGRTLEYVLAVIISMSAAGGAILALRSRRPSVPQH